MSRVYSHINTATTILHLYKNEVPFALFLKNFFSKEKKYGSKDRKNISSLCYNFFRIGNAFKSKTIEQKLLISIFLFSTEPNDYLEEKKPEWFSHSQLPLEKKLIFLKLDVTTIFPSKNEISNSLEAETFCFSFLIQPNLFVRIRRGHQEKVVNKLNNAQVAYEKINEHCFSFSNSTKLDTILEINKEVVIQDYSSQRTGELLAMHQYTYSADVWDCCAASGGKSMMAYDLVKNIRLTVSDVRESILQNLKKRFNEAGIDKYTSFICDLTNPSIIENHLQKKKFDIVLCDAPCSGSGTWGRTPEQLAFFKAKKINQYSKLQKTIVSNTIPYIKKGGYFVYITCSVFTKENEEVVAFIQQNTKLQLIQSNYYKGYTIGADTLFGALFKSV